MNIIEPGAEALTGLAPLEHVEHAGRVCYASLDRAAPGTAEPFVRNLMSRRHLTPLESARVRISLGEFLGDGSVLKPSAVASLTADISRNLYPRVRLVDDIWVECNCRDLFAMLEDIAGRPAEDETVRLMKSPRVHMDPEFATFVLTCDRGVGNELVRHRVLHYDDCVVPPDIAVCCPGSSGSPDMSMVQASTRYISYGKHPYAVVRPLPAKWAKGDSSVFDNWAAACERSLGAYEGMLRDGIAPQYARNVLPLSTATTIVMSGTLDQWKDFMELRTDKAAHPQMRWLCLLILQTPEMRRLYTLGGDLTVAGYDRWLGDLRQQLEE